MEFEFDPNKSASNLEKHGIGFEEVQKLWENTTVCAPVKGYFTETRCAVFGVLNDKHWTVIVTIRSGRIRIISARRSRKEEEAFYESRKDSIC